MASAATPIDVWDVATFDPELAAELSRNAEVIQAYWRESRRLFEEREAQTVRGPPELNRFGWSYQSLGERITALMEVRTIRAWHFTRLTDREVAGIVADGMPPMTLAVIRGRLDRAVAEGAIGAATADELYAASPYHRQIDGNRENRTWLAAQPYPIDDSGVVELLATWGGESIGFNHRSGRLRDMLKGVGRPRVLEMHIPLSATTRAGEAANNVLDAYSFTLGCYGGWGGGADIVVVEPVEPEWIEAVHSEVTGLSQTWGGAIPRPSRPRAAERIGIPIPEVFGP